MRSELNGNPYPEKWTLVCKPNTGKDLIEPRGTEDDARRAFGTYRAGLKPGVSITSAYIIPPDGDGPIIPLAGHVPASV